ncbi:uncharacterized protein DUF222 [Pseudonocardia hierapolitana]|uniref:Uncharacterized protein DUF222 n=2 Tax=Pseudonocardia hierapolitana TaxID=1128676 RepID=A0A561T148_9PSEU|nr:uncharacterized protein DUF222 [Pseudonocardia hierapolitana]
MPGVVELIDQAVHVPPGPELSALLAQLPWDRVPNARLVEVLQAHSRQLAHAQARLFAGMAEIARAAPVAGLPDDAVVRTREDVEWASHEIAAALTWTPTTADRELDLSLVLVRGLPLVFAALEQGLIDRGKATVIADHLDPGRGELTPTQIRRLCERFVPLAPRLTAGQLSRRLLTAIQAIDPDYHRRRYRRGLRERGVVLHLNRNGTATLVGEGLPPDEAAAAAARLDRLAEAARRAGHPARLGQITADLYLGMVNGSFHGLTEAQILDRLLAHPRPEDTATATAATSDDTAAEDTASEDPASEDTASEDTASEDTADTDEIGGGIGTGDITGDATEATGTGSTSTGSLGIDSADAGSANPISTTPDSAGFGSAGFGSTGVGSGGAVTDGTGPVEARAAGEELAGEEPASEASAAGRAPDPASASPAGESQTNESLTSGRPTGTGPASPTPTGSGPVGIGADRWRGEPIGVRDGIELRIGLASLLGCDQRPGEIPGLGPINAEIARLAVARQRRGAGWQYAIVDTSGYLLLAGPLRRRPRVRPPGAGPPDRVRGGVVELHLTLAELARFAADPDLTGDWAGIIAEIAQQWADRHRLWRELSMNPRTRYARGALARHVQVRDRTCIGPCCDRSSRRSQLDHTRDHAHGGDTVEGNIGPGCWRHHQDKDRGWTLTQPEPGHFVWISPLGRTYRTRGGPVRPDLPEPEPPAEGTDRREDPEAEHG